jgi:dihydropyrimidinase
MNVDYSGYEGWELSGKSKNRIAARKVAIDNGNVFLKKVMGFIIEINVKKPKYNSPQRT